MGRRPASRRRPRSIARPGAWRRSTCRRWFSPHPDEGAASRRRKMEFLGAIGGATGSLLWGYLVPFLFVLTIVVFIHELGHFLVGRWCGVGVTAFSIGFGPELIGWNDRHGTRWKLSAIPLGGYVKFAGDANGASVPDAETMASMAPHDRAISFPHKHVAKRAAIVAAGPIANFLLAIAVF